MKLFLSWSGKLSREIAVALDDWLPYVIQSVKPFVSTGDIDKGRRWSEVLASELAQVGYGIIILTRDNLREPWINFEAGAISKALDKSWVSPFLFGVDPTKLAGPLQQFQATVFEQEDVFNLIRSINSRLDEEQQVGFEVLRNGFEVWWPKLKKRVDEILTAQPAENETGYDWLFSSTDMVRHMSQARHVWIVARRLYNNALAAPIRGAINDAVKAGAVYTFLMHDGDDGSADFHRMAAAAHGTIRVVLLDDREFQSVAVTDYFILDPDSETVAVFLELPIEARGYWIEVDREAAVGLVERFRQFVNRILTETKPVDLGPR